MWTTSPLRSAGQRPWRAGRSAAFRFLVWPSEAASAKTIDPAGTDLCPAPGLLPAAPAKSHTTSTQSIGASRLPVDAVSVQRRPGLNESVAEECVAAGVADILGRAADNPL